MKKSLIALAVLASSGAVMAQSSVTLYGLVDAYVGHTSNTTAAGVKTNKTAINSSGANNSRWGLRGSEDLGGGLKANFVLESQFATDDGSLVGNQFARQASVGLSGDFGAVSLGRQNTAYDALYGATNNLYDTNVATTSTVWGNGVAKHTSRASNSIAYTSPVYSGFSGAAVYGFGEDKIAGRKASYNASLNLKYANGPLLAGYAYQEELSLVTSPAPRNVNKYHLVAGSYDLGVAKLTGGFSLVKDITKKDKEFQVGVSAPFGAAAVAAGYSYSKDEVNATGVVTKMSGLSLLGTYSLSKRTTLYAGVNGTKVKNTSVKSSLAAVGIRHTF